MIRFILAFKNNFPGSGSASGGSSPDDNEEQTIPGTSNILITGIIPIEGDEEYSNDYFNYLYILSDKTATGNDRVWKHCADYRFRLS